MLNFSLSYNKKLKKTYNFESFKKNFNKILKYNLFSKKI